VLGPNCLIFQQVTLGADESGVPIIGGQVDFGAGAKVIGPVKIGDHALIGANAVVVCDVPPGPRPSACPRGCCRADPSRGHDVGMSLEPTGPRGADIPRVLIVADHASARFGGEAALPLHYFRVLRSARRTGLAHQPCPDPRTS
jgi:hypothetical protein